MSNKKIKKFNLVSLFCGCGGLDKGFEKYFKTIIANDIWESALKTYKENFKNTTVISGDITDNKIKEDIFKVIKGKIIDCLIGGPPCQAYSISGKRDPSDKRGQLYKDYLEIVKKCHPTFIVMENVKGILSMKHAKTNLTSEENKLFKKYYNIKKEIHNLKEKKRKNNTYNKLKFKFTEKDEETYKELKKKEKILNKKLKNSKELVIDKIINDFKNLGYKIEYFLCNSADYGVPQKRERIIFIGTTLNIELKKPPITHSKNGIEKGTKKWKTVKEAIGYLEEKNEDQKINHIFTKHKPDFIEKIKKVKWGNSLNPKFKEANFKAHPDKPSPTVKANNGALFLHYNKNRVMSNREIATLQDFPNEFIFKGTKGNISKQIGNAVPVGLSENIAKYIFENLQKN